MPDFSHVSWLAVVVGAIAIIVIGFVWYLPQVFGKRWESSTGMKLVRPQPVQYAMLVVQALLVAFVVAFLLSGVASILHGAVWGALIWLGLVATTSLGAVIFERKSWTYWVINNGYWLVSLVVVGAIVGLLTGK